MITTDDLSFFDVVARSPSLAAAARTLDVTPPAVTQRLRALEQKLGVRLIDRSARSLTLTDEGEFLVTRGSTVLQSLDEISESLASRAGAVVGHLRVAAPYGFGRVYIAPVAAEFACLFPQTTLTLELSDHPASLTMDSWDVVVHIGELAEASRVVTTLARNDRILCASPDYLSQHAALVTPSDLSRHRCLALRENNEDVTLWRFSHRMQGAMTVRIQPAMASNDGAVIREWALSGRGIIVRSQWDVAEDLRRGALVQIMPDWALPSANVAALLGARHGRAARTTEFLKMLRQSLARPAWRLETPAG